MLSDKQGPQFLCFSWYQNPPSIERFFEYRFSQNMNEAKILFIYIITGSSLDTGHKFVAILIDYQSFWLNHPMISSCSMNMVIPVIFSTRTKPQRKFVRRILRNSEVNTTMEHIHIMYCSTSAMLTMLAFSWSSLLSTTYKSESKYPTFFDLKQ